MTTESPKRRRWFQFRLRTLLIAILVLSVPLSWFGARFRRAKRQREALREIQQLGGLMICEPGKIVITEGKFQYPRFSVLRTLFGRDYLTTVTSVDFEHMGREVTDADLGHLNGMTNLKYLSLAHTQITDEGLVHLEPLTNLEYVDLRRTKVTDDGLEYLESLTNLERLQLADTKVTPKGVKMLQKALPNCDIELHYVQVRLTRDR